MVSMRKARQGTARAFFRLTRIEHSLMLVLAVLAAEIISSGGIPGAAVIIPSFVAPIFISMGSFAINDYFDVEVDRANGKSDRPLVSGALSRRSAMAISMSSFAIGVAASAFINAPAFLIALAFALLAMLYSYRLKEMPAIGNLYIAASMAIPFLFGDFAVSQHLSPTIVLLSFTVLASGFAREVHGTIRDLEGDRRVRNVRSIPKYIGVPASAFLAALFYGIAIALSAWLFFFPMPFNHNLFYAGSIAVTDALLVYVSVAYLRIRKRTEKSMFSLTRNMSLSAMALALAIYLLSCFVYL